MLFNVALHLKIWFFNTLLCIKRDQQDEFRH